MAEQDRKLEGFLLKQGEGTLGRAFKKRWFSQKGTCLYYYRNKSDTNTAGFINLAEAISCHPTEGVKGKFLFQINTPRRIWHLEAETEAAMQYWVDGIKAIFNKLREEEERGRQFDRRSVRLETMENRVRDLEARDQLLKQALELACQRLGVSADQVFSQVDKGSADSLKELLEASASASTSTSTSTSSAQPAETTESEHHTETSAAAPAETSSTEAATTTTEAAAPAAEEPASTSEATSTETSAESSSTESATPAAVTSESVTPAAASESTESATPAATATESSTPAASEPSASSDSDSKPADSSDDSKKSGDQAQPDKRFKAKVLYDYSAQQDYEMTIHTNEIITVLSKHGNGWWLGASAEGKQGYFPGSYVEPIAE